MLIADPALMVRLEMLVVAEIERFVTRARDMFPDSKARALRVGEGIASFGGDEIPFNEAIGLGVSRPVTTAEIDLIEAFYDDCGAASEVLACSLGDMKFMTELSRRGWLPTGYEDVLVLPLAEAGDIAADPEVDIRIVEPHERDRWAECVATGFSETGDPTEMELRFGRIVASRARATLMWAWVDGAPVATAELTTDSGVGWLSADTTLPEARGRGIQQALQRARVALAREAGCDIAVSEAMPGGPSHRNMQRQGFRVAYTHLVMERPARP